MLSMAIDENGVGLRAWAKLLNKMPAQRFVKMLDYWSFMPGVVRQIIKHNMLKPKHVDIYQKFIAQKVKRKMK